MLFRREETAEYQLFLLWHCPLLDAPTLNTKEKENMWVGAPCGQFALFITEPHVPQLIYYSLTGRAEHGKGEVIKE